DGLPCASPRGWHKCQVLGDARHDNRWLRNLGCPSCAVVAHRGLEKIAGLRLGFQRDPRSAGLPAEFKHINKRRKRNLQGFPLSAKWIRNLGKRIGSRAGHGGPGPEPVGCRWTARAAPRGESGSPLARSYRALDYDRTPLSRIRARSDACARRPFADPRRGPRPPKARVVGEALAADELRGPP
ncbi:unnamed protein product, partial [Prunus brigantina]